MFMPIDKHKYFFSSKNILFVAVAFIQKITIKNAEKNWSCSTEAPRPPSVPELRDCLLSGVRKTVRARG